MTRSRWTGWVCGVLAGGALLGWTGSLLAQGRSGGATARVASINVGTIFSEYQLKKDLDEEMKQVEDKMQLEMDSRRKRIDQMQATVDAMNPNDPTYGDQTRAVLKAQVEFKNWIDMAQADMTRELALWTTRIYSEILEMTEQVAQRDGYDIVLYHDQFQPGSLDPQAIQNQISQRRIVYVAPQADITNAVLDALNARYRSQPQSGPKIQIP